MGRGAVHIAQLPVRQPDPVQGIRVSGAVDVLHPLPRGLRSFPDALHERTLAAARPAFDDPEKVPRLGGGEFLIERIEPLAGVGSQKAPAHQFRSHLTFPLSRRPVCPGAAIAFPYRICRTGPV